MTKFLLWVLAIGAVLLAGGILFGPERLGGIGGTTVAITLALLLAPSVWRAKVAESRLVLWLEEKTSGSHERRKDG
jgi:hypothetical protein